MPYLDFTFGIGTYFNFTFHLQLGRQSPIQAERAEPSEPAANDQTHPPLPPLAVNGSNHDETPVISSGQRDDQSDSISDTQSSSSDSLCRATDLYGDSLDLDEPSPSASLRRAVTACSLAQTPRSIVDTSIQASILRDTFLCLNNDQDRTRHVPTREAASSPPEKHSCDPSSQTSPKLPTLEAPSTPGDLPLSLISLPLEIKQMIYHELLVSSETIRKPHRLVCNKRSIMVDSLHPVKDIDSTVLRVCRSIYAEALPILYGGNTFEFAKPRKFRDFSHGFLDKRNNPRSAFRQADSGRFTLIRSVILRLGYDRKPYMIHRPAVRHIPPLAPDRKRIWSHWHQYFFTDADSRTHNDWGWFPTVGNEFPALDKVELDFTDWQLGEVDAIRIEPFVTKLRKHGGLSAVVIRGLTNPTNLRQLKQGLLKPGGSFSSV